MNKKFIEEIFIALSLSNLLFITSWRRLIYPNSEAYHIKLEPYPLDYLGLVLNVILTAIIFLGGLWLVRAIREGKFILIAKLAFIFILLVSLNGIRLQFFETSTSTIYKLILSIIILVPSIFIVLKWQKEFFNYAKSFVLILSPFIFITFSQAILGMLMANPLPETNLKTQLSKIQPKEKSALKARIIWIIYDDFSYFIPFGQQPSLVNLPEFEKLKAQSLFAAQATSPAHDTIDSIPALLTGKPRTSLNQPIGRNDLLINPDEEKRKFSETSNIFSEIKSLGGETSVVGWFHPYCRVVGKDLSACHWESGDTVNDFESLPLPQIILKNFIETLPSFPFGLRLQDVVTGKLQNNDLERYAKRHRLIIDGAKEIITDPQIDIAFIHLPFPHYPYLYDKTSHKFGTKTSYFDNLALSDEVLGEFRKSLETANLWDSSTIIVSADHQWRIDSYKACRLEVYCPSEEELRVNAGKEDSRVPFILKLKDQKESVIYDKPFNTGITHDLILTIMKGEVSTVEEVKNWLDKNAK